MQDMRGRAEGKRRACQGRRVRKAGLGESSWPEERPWGEGETCVGGSGGRLPGLVEGTEVAERMGSGGRTPGGPRSWTGLQQRNLSPRPLPLPHPLVLKSPRHLRLQEGKEPEKQSQTIWICFLGLKKKIPLIRQGKAIGLCLKAPGFNYHPAPHQRCGPSTPSRGVQGGTLLRGGPGKTAVGEGTWPRSW